MRNKCIGEFLRNAKQNTEKTWIKIFIFGLNENYPYPWMLTLATIFHTLGKRRGQDKFYS